MSPLAPLGFFAKPAGVTGSYESIASATGDGSSGTITFSSIPSTYKSLQVRWMCRTTNGGTSDTIFMRMNGDTGSNYARHYIQGNGTTVSASGAASQTNILFDATAGGTEAAGVHSVGVMDIHEYSNTSMYKTSREFFGIDRNGSGACLLLSGLWMSTSAINSLTFYTNSTSGFATSTSFALYGIKGA